MSEVEKKVIRKTIELEVGVISCNDTKVYFVDDLENTSIPNYIAEVLDSMMKKGKHDCLEFFMNGNLLHGIGREEDIIDIIDGKDTDLAYEFSVKSIEEAAEELDSDVFKSVVMSMEYQIKTKQQLLLDVIEEVYEEAFTVTHDNKILYIE